MARVIPTIAKTCRMPSRLRRIRSPVLRSSSNSSSVSGLGGVAGLWFFTANHPLGDGARDLGELPYAIIVELTDDAHQINDLAVFLGIYRQ